MKCEEFEMIGLGLDRERVEGADVELWTRTAAIEHVDSLLALRRAAGILARRAERVAARCEKPRKVRALRCAWKCAFARNFTPGTAR